MFRKTHLVWKVNGLILVILVSVLGVLSYVTNQAYERDALTSARDVSRVNSQTILRSIRGFMMRRDTAGMGDLFDRLMSDNTVYRDIRLISHDGGVVVGGRGLSGSELEPGSWPCRGCHGFADRLGDPTIPAFEEILGSDLEGRVVSVVTPIYREGSCGIAGCHTEPTPSPVLGLLQADFSLQRVDALIAQRFLHTVLAVLVSVLLCSAATWWVMDRLVGRRIRVLRNGAARVARKDFEFRFRDTRGDGIAQMSGTFDNMLSDLSATLSELTSTKEYMQGIIESSADLIITVDPSGLIETFNTGAEKILGYRREEVIGKKIEMLFADPSEREVAIARLSETDHVVNYETHFVTKEGEKRDVILTLSRLRTPAGVPVGTFGISKDVTKEKRLQRELILQERLAAIGEAVAGIHHTLKNMLGSLKGGSYMVNIGLDEDDRVLLGEGWTMVQDGISRINELSSRMLQYVREWEPEIEETVLADLVSSIYKTASEVARGKGIALRTEAPHGLPTIFCDPRLIHTAVNDLLINALDACEWKDYRGQEVPEVVLRAHCAEDGRRVVMEVRDNGQGMTEEIEKNIFAPFFSTKTNIGTGMGLTLALRIVRLHGGTIEVESEPSRGSTFRISLPVGAPQGRKEENDA